MRIRHDRSIRQPSGFTLVELLVVITIIGMLMALLLPAVNAAVEAARNVQCKNNVGQLSKAANVYQADKNRYPGWENEITDSPLRIGSWVVEMLPFVDRLDLHYEYVNTTPLGAQHRPYMEMLVCPSDPPETIGGPVLSYVANSGMATQLYVDAADQKKAVKNGIFHNRNVRTNVDHLLDGTSFTLMFTENIQARKDNGNLLPEGWATLGGTDAVRRTTTFVWFDIAASANPPTNSEINQGKTETSAGSSNFNLSRPSSFHSGGVNVAFADTRVIFLKQDIGYRVYRQLMTPHHRESDADDAITNILDEAAYK